MADTMDDAPQDTGETTADTSDPSSSGDTAGATDSGDSTGPGSSGDSGDSGDSTDGTGETGGEQAGYCAQSCNEDADCCPLGSVLCPSEDYPDNWSCVDNVCEFGGCQSDDDCQSVVSQDDTCHEIGGVGTCFDPCAEDQDCAQGLTCTGVADDGAMYCTAEVPPCESDDDCGGFGVCDTDSGSCYCDSDANCTAESGDVCVMPR